MTPMIAAPLTLATMAQAGVMPAVSLLPAGALDPTGSASIVLAGLALCGLAAALVRKPTENPQKRETPPRDDHATWPDAA